MYLAAFWVVFLIVGIAIIAPMYSKFLAALRRGNPEVFDELGRPSLFMMSPRKSLALQRFLYSSASTNDPDADIRKLAVRLRWITPAFVAGIFILLAIGLQSGFGIAELI